MKDVLNLDIADSMKIPGDLQYTKERKVDVLAKITDHNNCAFLLHLEWQSKNDKNMPYRMAEYAVMLHRKYRLPVEQFVIYTGNGNLRMKRTINHKHLKFRFHIIVLKDVDYRIFLQVENPGLNVIAILGNFGNDGEDRAIENIVKAIEHSADEGLEEEKHFNQLRILVQLRGGNIELKLKHMLSTKTFFRKERDMFYKEGKEDGKVETQKMIAIRLKEQGLRVDFISKTLKISKRKVNQMLTQSEG
jgi:hypothetical protein